MSNLTKTDFILLADMGIPMFKIIVKKDRGRYVPRRIRELVLRKHGYRCRICGSQRDLQIDHVIPINRGGNNDLRNLQILCGRCNQQKGISIVSERSYEKGYIIIDDN